MAHPHSNLTRQVDNIEFNTSNLAAATSLLVASRIDSSRANGFRTVSQRGVVTWKDADGSQGPIMVGMVNDAMSTTELEEAIENDPQSSSDRPGIEHAERRYYLLGYLHLGPASNDFFTFNVRHRLSIIQGITLQFFVYNTDLSTALDAANSVQILCEHLGVWLRD